MISDVQSDLGSWVRRLLNDPDSMLRVGNIKLRQDVFTNRELRRAGIEQVNGTRPVRTSDGTERYYAIRNAERWVKADHDDILAHLVASRGKAAHKY